MEGKELIELRVLNGHLQVKYNYKVIKNVPSNTYELEDIALSEWEYVESIRNLLAD